MLGVQSSWAGDKGVSVPHRKQRAAGKNSAEVILDKMATMNHHSAHSARRSRKKLFFVLFGFFPFFSFFTFLLRSFFVSSLFLLCSCFVPFSFFGGAMLAVF